MNELEWTTVESNQQWDIEIENGNIEEYGKQEIATNSVSSFPTYSNAVQKYDKSSKGQ